MKPNLLIVGASSGVGAALAENLSSRYRILALARRRDRLEAIAAEIPDLIPIVFDVSDLEGIEQIVKETVKKYGALKSLVYCAGVQQVRPVRMLRPDDLRSIFDVNTFAPLFFARSFASRRHHEAGASMLFIGSVAGLEAEKGIVAYSASKAALHNLVQGLARELAPIRVNGLAPGFMRTEMTEAFAQVYNEAFIRGIESKSPLGLVTPKDLAESAAFLLGEGAGKITGEVFRIDGGFAA